MRYTDPRFTCFLVIDVCRCRVAWWLTGDSYVGSGDGDIDYASVLLKQCLARYPRGTLFLFLEARLLQVTGKLDEVIVLFK